MFPQESVRMAKNVPTIFVLLGATGDLVSRKIVPALFDLSSGEHLPDRFRVVGFSRRELTNETFCEHLRTTMAPHIASPNEKRSFENFLSLFSYSQGHFSDQKGYAALARHLAMIDKKWGQCSNKLFYIAAGPEHYETIFNNLSKSGLTSSCGGEEGWTRVIVEKPFGNDLATAEKLDLLLGSLFKEEQIYRIDHYLAKEMLQNILSFRFSNNLFEDIWNRDYIESIEIRLLETLGVEKRGPFYDAVGALRDVGQNHLLQMLALLTMERPSDFRAKSVRKKRGEILRNLLSPVKAGSDAHIFRAQHEGYKDIPGVSPNSKRETYFRIQATLDHPRWKGVPIFFEGGKRFPEAKKEAVVTLRHPIPCLCPPGVPHRKNRVIFMLEPEERIIVEFWSKKPGLRYEVEKRIFDFSLRRGEKRRQYVEEYEKLLLDCIRGEQTLFVTTEEVKAMWGYIDPILKQWEDDKAPLLSYKPGTEEIFEKIPPLHVYAVRENALKKEIGIIGLGKMGGGIARRLSEKGWRVVGLDGSAPLVESFKNDGGEGARTLGELVEKLPTPRVLWLMVPSGRPVDDVIKNIMLHLSKGDTVIDGGNSYFKDAARRAKVLSKKKIQFLDVGVSGGPGGARNGPALMIGGEKKVFEKLESLFGDLACPGGYKFFRGAGAGHFVKMIHNGIEYGMMQSIAEGFNIMNKSKFNLDLNDVVSIYNNGSVVESRLTKWLEDAYRKNGTDLKNISGSVAHTGEGAWTVKTAKEMKLRAKVIEGSFMFRVDSEKKPDYTGQVLSALRAEFGGHEAKKKKNLKKK